MRWLLQIDNPRMVRRFTMTRDIQSALMLGSSGTRAYLEKGDEGTVVSEVWDDDGEHCRIFGVNVDKLGHGLHFYLPAKDVLVEPMVPARREG